jgi:hypothetical protein
MNLRRLPITVLLGVAVGFSLAGPPPGTHEQQPAADAPAPWLARGSVRNCGNRGTSAPDPAIAGHLESGARDALTLSRRCPA